MGNTVCPTARLNIRLSPSLGGTKASFSPIERSQALRVESATPSNGFLRVRVCGRSGTFYVSEQYVARCSNPCASSPSSSSSSSSSLRRGSTICPTANVNLRLGSSLSSAKASFSPARPNQVLRVVDPNVRNGYIKVTACGVSSREVYIAVQYTSPCNRPCA